MEVGYKLLNLYTSVFPVPIKKMFSSELVHLNGFYTSRPFHHLNIGMCII